MMIYLCTNEFNVPMLYLAFDFIKSTGNPPQIETIIGVITMATISNPIGWAVDSWTAKTRTPKHIKTYIAKKNAGFNKPFIASMFSLAMIVVVKIAIDSSLNHLPMPNKMRRTTESRTFSILIQKPRCLIYFLHLKVPLWSKQMRQEGVDTNILLRAIQSFCSAQI